MSKILTKFTKKVRQLILSVPVRWKIVGIGILPVIILGVSLNYWITTGLADWLSYILTDVRVQAAMRAGSRSVMFVTVIAAVLSIILLMLLVYILTNPIEELKSTAQEVASGKFETRAVVWAKDEIGSLAISVNQMIDNFVSIQENLSRTNQQLEAINRIALAADREDDIHDVLFIALESMLSLMELETGWVYLYDPEVDKFHLASWKGVPEALQDPLLSMNEENLCECLVKIRHGSFPGAISIQPCRHLEALNRTGGYNDHISLLIEARNIQFGVIQLHYPSRKPLTDEAYTLLDALRTKISEVVANAWLQIKLREKEAARLLLLESLVSAQEDERRHLARELHDQAGQGLTSLLIRLKAIEKMSHEQETKSRLLEMQNIVSNTIEEIRDLSYSLRPPALEEFGLGAAVNALVEDFTAQTGLKIRFKNRIEQKVSTNVEMVLYRIVQEGLTNVARHANASEVVIELEPRESTIYLKIEDNGRGFDPNRVDASEGKRHLGLISMSERTELLGGKMTMYSTIGAGTTIEVVVPCMELDKLYG